MSLSLEELARLRVAVEEQGPIRAHQARQWVSTLVHVAQTIATDRERSQDAYHCLFWMRIQQILAELLPYCRESRDVHEQFGLAERAQLFTHVIERCETIAELFTEDELVWLQYRRDSEGHIWQESYEIGVKGLAVGAKIKETRRFETISKTLNVEDAMTRMRALLRKYGNTSSEAETNIAVDFASRTVEPLRELLLALTPFEKLTLNIAGRV